MLTTKTRSLFLALAIVAASSPAFSETHGGVFGSGSTSNPADLAAAQKVFPSLLTQALSSRNIAEMVQLSRSLSAKLRPDTLTTFDLVTAPCFFFSTTPLSGVVENAYFQGFNGNGGAILNQCSNFGLNAYSMPNFLAFNKTTAYSTGVAELPELIVVGPNKSSISMYVSGGGEPGYPIALIGLGQGGVEDVVPTILTDGWVQVTVSGTGITSVLLVGSPQWLVVDNVSAQ